MDKLLYKYQQRGFIPILSYTKYILNYDTGKYIKTYGGGMKWKYLTLDNAVEKCKKYAFYNSVYNTIKVKLKLN